MHSKKYLYTISVLIVLSLTTCTKTEEFNIVNLNNNRITALGHGGMGIGQKYAMNTYESITYALSLGADGSEIDIQITKDNVIVAYHDQFLEESFSITGEIYKKSWSEIKHQRYHELLYSGVLLRSLDEIFSNIKNKQDYTFFLDCKTFDPDTSYAYLDNYTNTIISLLDKHNLSSNVIIELKRTDLAAMFKEKRPNLKLFYYTMNPDVLSIINTFKFQGITISTDRISKEQVQKFHQNGTMVSVFNAHTQERNIESIKKNVDFIQSDKLKHLLEVLGRN